MGSLAFGVFAAPRGIAASLGIRFTEARYQSENGQSVRCYEPAGIMLRVDRFIE
jgi:hypothetical protein